MYWEKDLCNWNIKKIDIQNKKVNLLVKKRQFWLYYIWVNIWNEESKENPFLRPCLVLNNYLKWDLILIIPLTSKYNKNLDDIFFKINGDDYGLDKDSYLLLNQFKVISKKRLIRKIEIEKKDSLINNNDFLKVIAKIKGFI